MAKFHISPDGVARRCNAGKGENARGCHYGYSDEEHYTTKEDALKGAEQKLSKENGGSFGARKKESVNNIVKPTRIERNDPLTGENNTMVLNVSQKQLDDYDSGVPIQAAFADLSAEEREFIKTGITPDSWDSHFGSDTDDENDVDLKNSSVYDKYESAIENSKQELLNHGFSDDEIKAMKSEYTAEALLYNDYVSQEDKLTVLKDYINSSSGLSVLNDYGYNDGDVDDSYTSRVVNGEFPTAYNSAVRKTKKDIKNGTYEGVSTFVSHLEDSASDRDVKKSLRKFDSGFSEPSDSEIKSVGNTKILSDEQILNPDFMFDDDLEPINVDENAFDD